jgi:hypothetical protein
MEIKGWSLEELAKAGKTSENTAQQALQRAGIKPFFRGSIYPDEAMGLITGRRKKGRPPKKPKGDPQK